ncbi:MAG: hypothetical protein M3R63_25660 [Actinomycetota bacterium]|nr:hypothetical protein [Actinomycetota bacterium]
MTEQTKLQRLAEYYDTHDTSEELERAERVDEPVDPDPMVSLSLRLPTSLLDWCARAGPYRAHQADPADPPLDRGAPHHRGAVAGAAGPPNRGPRPTQRRERLMTCPA